MVILPPPKHSSLKKVLIFDIDETLIHCLDEKDAADATPDVIIKIPLDEEELKNSEDNPEGLDHADAGINIRPHVYDCLKQANELF